MRKTDLTEILETVEEMRRDLHPDLDSAFVKAVVRAEEENPDDDERAARAIEKALQQLMKSEGIH